MSLISFIALVACHTGSPVDKDGTTDRLFPKTPLSDAPCIEDQDCIVTHLVDGSCCSDPEYAKKNLYTRDQYLQLVAHQDLVCTESKGHYSCPSHEAPGHVDTVFHGACVEQRCVLKSVPAEAPHSPHIKPPSTEGTGIQPAPPPESGQQPEPTTTAASPKAEG